MRSRLWGASVPVLVTGMIALALVVMVNLITPGFFLRDDAVNEFLPYIAEEARLLASGQLPIFTADSLSGGNLLINFQRSMFHPTMIAAALTWSATASIEITGGLVVVLNLWGAMLGGYAAAAAFGANRTMRWFVALTVATGPMMLFMYLPAWWNAGIGMSAFLFVLAALQWHFRDRTGFSAIFVGLASIYTLLIGWPHGFVAMAILYTAYWLRIALDARRAATRRWFLAPWRLAAAAAVAILVGLPLISEYLTSGGSLARTTNITNDNLGVPALSQLLNIVNPSGGDYWHIWGGYRWWPIPIALVSLGLVSLAFVRDWGRLLRRGDVRFALLLAGVFLFLTQLPSEFGPLRMPFRMIPYGSVFIALAAAIILTHATMAFTWRRVAVALGALGVVVAFGAFRVPTVFESGRSGILLPAATLAIAAVVLVLAMRMRRVGALTIAAGVLGVAVVGAQMPRGLGDAFMGPTSVPDLSASEELATELPDGYLLHAVAYFTYDNAVLPDLAAARYLLADVPLLNGYDPVGFTPYQERLAPIAVQGMVRLAAVDAMAQPSQIDPTLCELTVWGVRSVVTVAEPGKGSGARRAALEECGFEVLARDGDDTLWIDRTHEPMNGTLSWASPELTDVATVEAADRVERIEVRNASDDAGTLLFSRLAWPGYSATASTGEPLKITPYDDTLLAVEVPAEFEGDVTISYAPRSWRWALPLAGAGALGGLALAIVAIRSRTRAAQAESGGVRD
ncbi:hypothetical protein ACWDR7_09795 [Microbacterium sp. NPDC003461]